MKRSYSMEYLVSGIILLGVSVWYLFLQRGTSVFCAVCWAIVGGLNIYRAFSPRYIETMEEDKAIRQELFGVFAPLVAWGPVAGVTILIALCFYVPEGYEWLRWLYLTGILALGILTIWYSVIIERHRKRK